MVIVNGREIDWIKGENVEQTIKRSGSWCSFMSVFIGGKWIRKEEWTKIDVSDGDEIRALEIIAGG